MAHVTCSAVQQAISARADGEDAGLDDAEIGEHMQQCSDCTSHSDFVHRLRRSSIGVAGENEDVTVDVVRRSRSLDGMWTWSLARVVLVVCAVWVIASSVSDLLGLGVDDVHEARHLGAFTLAYGVALGVVVVRPARARTVLPVAIVVSGALAVTATIDVIEGHVPLVHEAVHLPELVSVAAVWILARAGLRDRGAPTERLRSV